MNRLNFLGVGPKIGRILLPWLGCTIIASCISKYFAITPESNNTLLLSGSVLLILGLFLYFSTVRILLNGLNEGRLVTNLTFSICQNPLCVIIIFLLFPALAFMLNSWLILTSCLLSYLLLKIYIKNEYQALEKFFGDEYLRYKSETPEFFPLPINKWMKKIEGYSK